MNYRRVITTTLILSAFSMHSVFAGQFGSRPSSEFEVGKLSAIGALHSDEVKSVCKFLDQKDINWFLRSSRRCSADVRGENLTTFTVGRVDAITLTTDAQLNGFLAHENDHFYAGKLRLEVSIQSEDELRRLLGHPRLHSTLSELRLIFPFEGLIRTKNNSERIYLLEQLAPFKKLTSVDVVGIGYGEPTVAFTLLQNKSFDAFKTLILGEPRHLIIKHCSSSLAHKAACMGELDIVQFIAEILPDSMKAKDSAGWTAAHKAVFCGQLAVVQFLAEHVQNSIKEKISSTKEKSENGFIPAHVAAAWEKWDVLKFLAQHDPSTLNIKDDAGKTVLDFARQYHAPQALLQELEQLADAAAEHNQNSSEVESQ
jgi:hypothetical protein